MEVCRVTQLKKVTLMSLLFLNRPSENHPTESQL
jgi:hypothetical protein